MSMSIETMKIFGAFMELPANKNANSANFPQTLGQMGQIGSAD